MKKHSKASGIGLERLCTQDWMQSTDTEYGVEFLEAWFQGNAYQKHRHDTYAIGEAELGWLNSSLTVTAEKPLNLDELGKFC